MTTRDPQVNIRLPADLKEQLHALAAENKRSVNAEVVAAIEQAIELHQKLKRKQQEASADEALVETLKSDEILKQIIDILSKNGI